MTKLGTTRYAEIKQVQDIYSKSTHVRFFQHFVGTRGRLYLLSSHRPFHAHLMHIPFRGSSTRVPVVPKTFVKNSLAGEIPCLFKKRREGAGLAIKSWPWEAGNLDYQETSKNL